MNKTASSTARQRSRTVQPQAKLFYRIQEVAELTGVKPYILRYWEREFKQLAPQKDKNDQRRYRQSDIDLILSIKDLLYNRKFTIAGARQHIRALKSNGGTGTPAQNHEATLRGIRAELYDLMSLLKV